MQTTAQPPLRRAPAPERPAVPELARQIMEAAFDAIILIDARLRIAAWNSVAEETFGWAAAEAIGREVVDLVPERLRATYRLGLSSVLAPESDLPDRRNRFETLALRSGGAEFPVELSLRSIGSGEDAILVACMRDLSDRQAVSAQAAAGEDHTRFVANMSHELRTPLNSVLGFAQLLVRDAALSERQRRYVGHIMEGGSHLLVVIDDILDLDRLSVGKAELLLERLPLRPSLESVVDRLGPLAAASGVRVRLKIGGSPEVDSDPRRLTQIIANLLTNAIKFTPEGGQVMVMAEAVDRTAEIAITDTGVGIPLADQERIFDPFAQVDSRLSRSHSGTGLGLALSRRLAILLGGQLTVASIVGGGSTFRLVLPLARSA